MQDSDSVIGRTVGIRHKDILGKVVGVDGPRLIVKRKVKPYGNAPWCETLWADEIVEVDQ